jgi:hypothetical protein
MSIVGMSHCVVNFEVAKALVQAVSRGREAKYLDDKALIASVASILHLKRESPALGREYCSPRQRRVLYVGWVWRMQQPLYTAGEQKAVGVKARRPMRAQDTAQCAFFLCQ